MGQQGVWYAWREDVRATLDAKITARDDSLIDRALESASRGAEGFCHRDFHPQFATRSFDWPNNQYARPWRLWLDRVELISVTTLSSGSVVIPSATGFFLEPQRYGPPFDQIVLRQDSSAAFGQASTFQRDITVVGLWGYRDDEVAAGALAAALSDTTGTILDVTDGSLVGVGALLRCETERLIVSGRQMITTGVTLGGDGLLSSASDQLLEANVGFVGEELLVDAERLLVIDVAGTNRIVKRAWNGSTLAAHSVGATVFASRRLTVRRGSVGSSAATHSNGTALQAYRPPGLLRELVSAEAIGELQQGAAGWGRTVGQGDSEREARGAGLHDIRRRARRDLMRKVRLRGV